MLKLIARALWNRLPLLLKKIALFGREHYCPVCRSRVRRFYPVGEPARPQARCGVCGTKARHLLMWLFFERRTDLLDGSPKRVLHLAPKPGLERRLKRAVNLDYLTADLFNPRAMVRMDITNIGYPDESFDVIICSHILEHVPEDRTAMRELCRVLKTGGWAVILVPISGDKTLEDPSITDPDERLRRFGQHDHVRTYGPDYFDRLGESGFEVERIAAHDLLSDEDLDRMALTPTKEVILCRKRGVTK